jgi:hypothetical protein
LAFSFQDDQQHVYPGAMYRDELAWFQAGEHRLHVCATCHQHGVESLRPECDRVSI